LVVTFSSPLLAMLRLKYRAKGRVFPHGTIHFATPEEISHRNNAYGFIFGDGCVT
jgi:hypothetical protein